MPSYVQIGRGYAFFFLDILIVSTITITIIIIIMRTRRKRPTELILVVYGFAEIAVVFPETPYEFWAFTLYQYSCPFVNPVSLYSFVVGDAILV